MSWRSAMSRSAAANADPAPAPGAERRYCHATRRAARPGPGGPGGRLRDHIVPAPDYPWLITRSMLARRAGGCPARRAGDDFMSRRPRPSLAVEQTTIVGV